MNILVKENIVIAIGSNITFGIYDEPNTEKWRVADENDKLLFYIIDYDYQLVENVEIPQDYVHGKYFYENGTLVLNTDWKPYVSPEERLTYLEEVVANLGGESVWDEMALAIEEGVNEV